MKNNIFLSYFLLEKKKCTAAHGVAASGLWKRSIATSGDSVVFCGVAAAKMRRATERRKKRRITS